KRNFLVALAATALGLSLIALPSVSGQSHPQKDQSVAELKKEIAQLKARLAAAEELNELPDPQIAIQPEVSLTPETFDVEAPQVFEVEAPQAPEPPSARTMIMALDGDGGSWLGVETQEVSAEKAKELKLSGEHGALVGKVLSDSPAAKAGLKENDVVTEIN